MLLCDGVVGSDLVVHPGSATAVLQVEQLWIFLSLAGRRGRWVSIDSGVEGSLSYPEEPYYTPRQQGKR